MKTFTEFSVGRTAQRIGVDVSQFDPKQIQMGLSVEQEHNGREGSDLDVVGNDDDLLKIVIAHLREDPHYYTKLKKVGL